MVAMLDEQALGSGKDLFVQTFGFVFGHLGHNYTFPATLERVVGKGDSLVRDSFSLPGFQGGGFHFFLAVFEPEGQYDQHHSDPADD